MFTVMASDSLPQRVARQIISQIILGRFRPGDALPTEEQLCDQFGVSRSVIREAMRTVAGGGMTRSRQGRGTVVLEARSWNEFSPEILQARVEAGAAGEFLADFIELRIITEPQAAGIAAERADATQLAAMRTHLEAMETAPDDLAAFIEADLKFHNAIIAATGNPMIVRLFDLLQPMLRIARERGHHPAVGNDHRDRRIDALEHRAVLTCIEARDPDAARQAMTKHLRWVATREVKEPAQERADSVDQDVPVTPE